MLGLDGIISGFFSLEGWQKTLVILGILVADSAGQTTLYSGILPNGIIGTALSPVWKAFFGSDITSAGLLFLSLMVIVLWKVLPPVFSLLMAIRQQRYLRRP